MTSKNVDSPCVRNCCLDQQDMCVGCFRMLDEIVGWGTASSVRKKEILAACSRRKSRPDVDGNHE
nr:DUF1289 domain-containing protein [Paraglaciecola agarilytica]